MEGAHRQLRAGLADGLCSDDADRFPDVDDRATRHVAAVALAANPDPRLTGQHRADPYRADRSSFDLVDRVLIDQRPRWQHDVAAERVEDVDRCAAAEDTVGERGDDLATFDDSTRHEPSGRAAILFGDDRVLRDIDEASR